ncbi:fluoride efflux transporter FluC [Pseudonocardia sp. TRM90224]|uniref:fluoride efflux transporter FluC n=1 Tax=Pseudonocardia sp. TRM90224 TaxID=2812678 RepID=UPI001E43DF26|nr:CrcB family protein [Pseudonocardia sp. TRM90224]
MVPSGQWRVFAAVAAGGATGALARYGVGLSLPWPMATFAINVAGCFLIGVVIVLLGERHPLARPFLTTGVLGGFTTFSTYSVDAQQLLLAGRYVEAGGYVAGTLLAAVLATWLGIRVAERGRA